MANTVTVALATGRPVVWLNVHFDTPSTITHVQVQRIVAGQVVGTLHPHTQADGGTYQRLSGGTAIMFDTEMPTDIPVSYIATDENGAAASVTSSEILVPSGGRLYLRNPVRPAGNITITRVTPQLNNDCLPAAGVYFQSMGATDAYPSQGAVNPVDGARYGAVTIKPRSGRTNTVNLVTRTFVDRDAVLALTDPGEPLQFSAPPQYGIPDTYMNVGEVDATRNLSDHRRQWRVVSLPFTAVAAPAGLTYGYLGARWVDQCQGNQTWTQANAAGTTGVLILEGQRGYPGSQGGVRGNTQILSDLAGQDGLDPTFQVYDPAIVVP